MQNYQWSHFWTPYCKNMYIIKLPSTMAVLHNKQLLFMHVAHVQDYNNKETWYTVVQGANYSVVSIVKSTSIVKCLKKKSTVHLHSFRCKVYT